VASPARAGREWCEAAMEAGAAADGVVRAEAEKNEEENAPAGAEALVSEEDAVEGDAARERLEGTERRGCYRGRADWGRRWARGFKRPGRGHGVAETSTHYAPQGQVLSSDISTPRFSEGRGWLCDRPGDRPHSAAVRGIPISITSTRRREKASQVERLWSLQPIHFV
jgi:hypothetical protein